jgi:hypothetical protein
MRPICRPRRSDANFHLTRYLAPRCGCEMLQIHRLYSQADVSVSNSLAESKSRRLNDIVVTPSGYFISRGAISKPNPKSPGVDRKYLAMVSQEFGVDDAGSGSGNVRRYTKGRRELQPESCAGRNTRRSKSILKLQSSPERSTSTSVMKDRHVIVPSTFTFIAHFWV